MIANALARALRREGFDAHASHRDVRKANRSSTVNPMCANLRYICGCSLNSLQK